MTGPSSAADLGLPVGSPGAPEEPVEMIYDPDAVLDPLGDLDKGITKNRAKVGSARPSALLYTYGVGAIIDLPQFSVMPSGLDDWDRIYARRPIVPVIDEPRLLDIVRMHLGPQVRQLRAFPWQPSLNPFAKEGGDLGVAARVFPQWLRCTGCDYLGPLSTFEYVNTHPFRPDLAGFFHTGCPGRAKRATTGKTARGGGRKPRRSPAVPARYLLACPNGHLDEFPYDLWVHRFEPCPKAPVPTLKLDDANLGQGVTTVVRCEACQGARGMNEARQAPATTLPLCRGRHPHLDAFDPACGAPTTLMILGASNLWFPSTQSVLVMPRTQEQAKGDIADGLRETVSPVSLSKYATQPGFIRDLAQQAGVDLAELGDDEVVDVVARALAPKSTRAELTERLTTWDPVELLRPEWRYLQTPALFSQQENASGLMVTECQVDPAMPPGIARVIAVDRMKRVNAVVGFTRIDQMDRVSDLSTRLVKMTRNDRPTWVPATEDRGEGVFLQLDEPTVATWEAQVQASPLWQAHRTAHRRNYRRRFSATAARVDPDTRLPTPRYWLVHTLAHVLLREMAMHCGYGAASLTERLYAWPESGGREPAAGLLICTTAGDSDGTLGGLVALSDPARLRSLVTAALRRAARCSSDPICAVRTPHDPEDFLHGAACHCCTFASETSCERSNRFLDRRFMINLAPTAGDGVPGFFGVVDDH